MRGRAFGTVIVLLLCGCAMLWAHAGDRQPAPPSKGLAWPPGLPVYDHVVIVVEENQHYGDIIGNPAAPYINNVLRAEGANFTKAYGEEHPSQGNYFWLFSGSNQSVGFADVVPSSKTRADYPLTGSSLGEQLLRKGLTFKGYAEDLPEIGSVADRWPIGGPAVYARKHVPWISFKNIPNGTTAATSCNLRFADFPTDPAAFSTLPTVAFVIPNLDNDMHNSRPKHAIPRGDRWLKENLDAYYQWAKQHNSLLILTFDENNDIEGLTGLTNPAVAVKDERTRDMQNRIVTIFAGARIVPGDYAEGNGITHVNILRTLEAMYGLPKSGAQQPNAAGNGIHDDFVITDIFAK